ncbi:HsdM family class I SAM-dependent methyltransferase [Candidatus Clostridium stratigraminis]|uniref:site-specific DNA-methyltransferase (adenine-specific) n=1 Tax=Candidatus Clostridium stratigraminis TaxID=3381661 RepID=A0ABW8T6V6_9CLOT
MAKASEEKTKGLIADKLKEIDGYPYNQNVEVDGVTWFKEDSYKGTDYDWLSGVFSTASKKQTMKDKGTPDFIVVKNNSEVIIVIECKGSTDNHMMLTDIKEYKSYGYGNSADTTGYAVNGALWYASFLNSDYDVVAIGVSGQSESECRVTSFVLPKGGEMSDIELLEDGYLDGTLVSINQYEKNIEVALNRYAATEELVRKELRRYTLSCANFLRSNGIEDNSKAGFISAVILGLTNHESRLYKDTKAAIERKNATKSKKMVLDPIGKDAVKMLKKSLYGDGNEYDDDYVNGIWDIDKIPRGKRTSLKKFYDNLLAKDELIQAPKGKDRYFQDGSTVLSCCVYSLYVNVIEVIERYSGIDVMGEFYTTFLRFTKGNAKEKGIVLTPKHVTDLFCDIAEFYSDEKFSEKTKIIDICCGTGAFLISALNRIKRNIHSDHESEDKKKERYEYAQTNSLIGVERDSSMYALAYANMRFHGDGKSNLFNCSSLLIDSYAPVDDSGKTYFNDKKITLSEALKEFGDIDVGMINPPYSLDKKDNTSTQEYPIVQQINELKDKNKKLNKKLKELKKKEPDEKIESEISKIEAEILKNKKELVELEDEFTKSGMREVAIQKGQDELDFITSMLHYLKIGGIGIAIIPMSCAGNSGSKLRVEMLKYHTLLACMTMPTQLFFDSHVGANTCIMVFKAHIPHDENKSVFFGRWKDDGFAVIPHNGRKNTGKWDEIRREWINQLDGTATPNDIVFVRKKIKTTDEALTEAYTKTDYSKIKDADFEKTLKKYALYKFMDENGLLEE